MTTHVDPFLVRDVRVRSGLTWRHLGLALGVGERAVHSWANGIRFNDHSRRLLFELRDEIDKIEDRLNEPALVRAELLAVGGKVEQMRRDRCDRIPLHPCGTWR